MNKGALHDVLVHLPYLFLYFFSPISWRLGGVVPGASTPLWALAAAVVLLSLVVARLDDLVLFHVLPRCLAWKLPGLLQLAFARSCGQLSSGFSMLLVCDGIVHGLEAGVMAFGTTQY